MDLEFEKKLKGTKKKAVLYELFSNSFHFPLAILTLDFLFNGLNAFLSNPVNYLILSSTFVQAYILGSRTYKRKSNYLMGNLITPIVYTATGLIIQGIEITKSPVLVSYWGLALFIGLMNELFIFRTSKIANVSVFLKGFLRSLIPALIYGTYISTDRLILAIKTGAFNQKIHLAIFTTFFIFAIVSGAISVIASHRLDLLWKTAALLKKYSEWLLGKGLMSMEIKNETTLSLDKKDRAIVHMGIAGFTAWSENKSPEVVVNLLNDYFQETELVWNRANAIKTRHIADEIMAIFHDPLHAIQGAFAAKDAVIGFLEPFGLKFRIGIHTGQMVEGLVGGNDIRVYDVVGETVAEARKVYDWSRENELLISEAVYQRTKEYVAVGMSREIVMNQDDGLMTVYPVNDLSLLL